MTEWVAFKDFPLHGLPEILFRTLIWHKAVMVDKPTIGKKVPHSLWICVDLSTLDKSGKLTSFAIWVDTWMVCTFVTVDIGSPQTAGICLLHEIVHPASIIVVNVAR